MLRGLADYMPNDKCGMQLRHMPRFPHLRLEYFRIPGKIRCILLILQH